MNRNQIQIKLCVYISCFKKIKAKDTKTKEEKKLFHCLIHLYTLFNTLSSQNLSQKLQTLA